MNKNTNNNLNFSDKALVAKYLSANPFIISSFELRRPEDIFWIKLGLTFIKSPSLNIGLFSFETKRNLVTNSAEFYDLSYEYLNDCLRAGVIYRRE